MNICFETFGCRLNRAEALEDEARCRSRGHTIVERPSEADLIVVRGCSVTGRAQRECERTIEHLRAKYPGKRIAVTGCLPTARPFEIDRRASDSPSVDAKVPTRTARAYLKVQDGCSCNCTFCIVPKFRGAPVSVDRDEVLDKARRFIDAGYHEIVVTGCNLSLYSSRGWRLAELVAALALLSPSCRIRLGSVEPGPAARDLVALMGEMPTVCRFLHLSVQSGSDRILASMHRPYLAKDVDALVSDAIGKMPFIGLGCDLIAGFPGESEVDFRLTQGLLRRHPFSNVHAFAYSERPGTVAAGLPGKIALELRRQRARELSLLAEENRRRFLRRFIGRTVEIVAEKTHPLSGWTGEYIWLEELKPLLIPGSRQASRRKECIAFKVREAKGGKLYGDEIGHGR